MAGPAIQRCPSRSATSTNSPLASGWPAGTARRRPRSVRVRSSSAGDSASGGRNGGAELSRARSTLPARSARTSAGVLPSLVTTVIAGSVPRNAVSAAGSRAAPALVSQRRRQQGRTRAGEPADVHGRGPGTGQLARGRVDLVQHPDGPPQDDPPGSGQPHPLPALFPQLHARRPFQGGDLPRHRGLRVAQRDRGGGEPALLGDRAEDPQGGQRDVPEVHDVHAYQVCPTVVGLMAGPFLA